MTSWQHTEYVDVMLDDLRTWAIVGLSGNPHRTAYEIAALLQRRGKRIVPIHPSAPTVLGEQGYATWPTCRFRSMWSTFSEDPTRQGSSPTEAVAVGAQGVWFQLGVIDEAAFERTISAGVPMVMDTCPAIEWRRR